MGESNTPFPGKGEGKILIMDDEEIILKTTGRLLTKLGYEVQTSHNGEEMLASFLEARQDGSPFHVVILDLTITGGMDGKEAIVRLQEIDRSVKAVVTSGYSNDPIMVDFRSHGFCAAIIKPYRIEELGETLRTVLLPV